MDIRDITLKDITNINAVQRLSTLKLLLIEKSLDIYFNHMGSCPDSVRNELLRELQPIIQNLVNVRVEDENMDIQLENTAINSRIIHIEHIARIANFMNRHYGSNWTDFILNTLQELPIS
jgi:hypothetical protein